MLPIVFYVVLKALYGTGFARLGMIRQKPKEKAPQNAGALLLLFQAFLCLPVLWTQYSDYSPRNNSFSRSPAAFFR